MKFGQLLALGCVLLFAGCGKLPATVSGTITLDGVPLANADISFRPTAPAGTVAYGRSDASGRYQLHTGTAAGLSEGSYQVSVVATALETSAVAHADPIPKLLTPEKYGNPLTSGLTAEVKPGKNTHNFDMVSTP